MKTKTLFKIAAFVVAIPAIVLLINLVMYSFVGYGFLPETHDDQIGAARIGVVWLSAVMAVMLVGASIE